MEHKPARIIAFYLPQFHPIPENDLWWGKGFTEWTNVGKAKPLFRGHDQPRVPADLGYYDLRLPESRKAQADLAREYGVEGFCYWHYYFGSKRRLLERPFNEVLNSGEPDFPFCLGWANHNWEDKLFSKEGGNKLLIEQTYGGEDDYTEHFLEVLKAFKDKRYIRVNNKPLFFVYAPQLLPDVPAFLSLWRKLAIENGLDGLHFVANAQKDEEIDPLIKQGFDAVNVVRLFHVIKREYNLIQRAWIKFRRIYLKRGMVIDYSSSYPFFKSDNDYRNNCYPSIFPNWDHSPRSGRNGHIFVNSNPKVFKEHVKEILSVVKDKDPENRIVFLRSWNEWAEGNYMEPDLKFGRGYLESLKSAINEFK
jgi:Glycosyltransferase WbsX